MLLLALALAWAPAPALGQDDVTKARFGNHIELAKQFFDEGEYTASIEELEKADALIPCPRCIHNIARCYDELGKPELAHEYFERFLARTEDEALADKARVAVERLVAELYGVVEVSCEPAEARVTLEGFAEAACPHRWERLRPGTYRLAVRADKHTPQAEPLGVDAGKVVRVATRLTPLPGQLTVRSEVAAGTVWLDGRRLGEAPVGPLEVRAGPHEVVVRTPGHDDWTVRVVVPPDQGVSVTATPRRGVGAIDVRSRPGGAAILLDGESAGRAPTMLREVAPGEHRLVLRLDGYRAWEQGVAVESGRTTRLEALLQAEVGKLRVTSEPAGAKIRIDGKHAGATPLALAAVLAGLRRIEVVREGYRPWEGEARVVDGEEAVVAARLERLPGLLVVRSEPVGAAVAVDGEQQGRSPTGRLELPEGEHTVRVALAGHRAVEERVVLRAGEESEVSVRLERQAGGTLAVTSGPPGATVRLDGEAVGETPVELELPPGRYGVDVSRLFYARRSAEVSVEEDRTATLHTDLPSRHLAWALGAGAVLAAAGSGLAYGFVIGADDERQDKQREYLGAVDPERTRALGDEMVGAWEQAYAAELTSRILLGVAVALAGWSTWSFLSSSGPEGGEAAAVPVLGGRSAGRRW